MSPLLLLLRLYNELLTKTTAARNGVALSYHSVRGLYFLAVVFVRSKIISLAMIARAIGMLRARVNSAMSKAPPPPKPPANMNMVEIDQYNKIGS